LELFFLAEVDTAHLVQRYLAIGRLDVVIAHVASALRAGASLDHLRRRHLATLLVLCRLHLTVVATSVGEEREFLECASADTDYDVDVVMRAALSVRAVSLALHVAHERDCVEKCVQIILESPALLPLTRQELLLVLKNGAMDGRLISCVLEPKLQLSVAANSQRLILPVIRATLPQMNVEELRFAEALLTSVAKSSVETEFAEGYMLVILSLVAKLGAEKAVDNGEGQMLLFEARKNVPVQQQYEQLEQSHQHDAEVRVSVVASGWNHSACIAEGRLFTWGKFDHGTLGLGQTFKLEELRANKVNTSPQLVVFSSAIQIHSVACGGDHTLALGADGTVWAFGLNDHGQLGTGDVASCDVPRQISLSFRIKAVACGHSHSCLLDTKGRLLGFGLDDDGQASGTTLARDVLVPQDLSAGGTNKKVAMIGVACGFAHTAMWSVDGEMFTVGNNVYGQLGRADGPNVSTRVTETIGTKRIQFASCGSFHTLAVTDLGSVYEWGGKAKQKPRLVEGSLLFLILYQSLALKKKKKKVLLEDASWKFVVIILSRACVAPRKEMFGAGNKIRSLLLSKSKDVVQFLRVKSFLWLLGVLACSVGAAAAMASSDWGEIRQVLLQFPPSCHFRCLESLVLKSWFGRRMLPRRRSCTFASYTTCSINWLPTSFPMFCSSFAAATTALHRQFICVRADLLRPFCVLRTLALEQKDCSRQWTTGSSKADLFSIRCIARNVCAFLELLCRCQCAHR
jgi:alpha-tubulin suppressor-like RCC1 family protein